MVIVLLCLVCTTILFWTWDRSLLLTSTLPPKTHHLSRISPAEAGAEAKHKDSLEGEKNRGAASGPALANEGSESGLSPANEVADNINIEAGVEAKHKDSLEGEKNAASGPTVANEGAEKGLSPANEVAANITVEENNLEKENTVENQDNINIEENNSGKENAVENQACNYAKGKWVIDDKRPFYSGSKCKQWLAPMWACRLLQRQDFSYEKLRWQPKDCQMEEFKGSEFLMRMRDRTLAFVGDSLGRQQFLSLMCMITGGNSRTDVKDVGKQYGFFKPRKGKRPNGWAYRFPSTNTTILYHWSSCLCELKPLNAGNPLTFYAMHLDRPPAFLQQFLHKIDVLVLNTGHHWNRGKISGNRWIMYAGGVPNTNGKTSSMGGAKNFTIHSIVKWVDSQLHKHPHLKAFYRSISPRHFVNGDWNTGGSCDNTMPMSVGKEVLQERSSDGAAESAVRGTGVKLLDITALSQVRDEGHISRFGIGAAASGFQDCLHWCLPGVPDTWNELLFAQL